MTKAKWRLHKTKITLFRKLKSGIIIISKAVVWQPHGSREI